MHTEEQSKRRRSNNLVVTGMPTSGIASDADRFVELCVEEFNRQPIVRSTSRLGNIISGKSPAFTDMLGILGRCKLLHRQSQGSKEFLQQSRA